MCGFVYNILTLAVMLETNNVCCLATNGLVLDKRICLRHDFDKSIIWPKLPRKRELKGLTEYKMFSIDCIIIQITGQIVQRWR